MIASNALVAEDDGFEIFAVQAGDVVDGDAGRASGFAFAGVGAGAEAFFVHLSDHFQHSLCSFWFTLRQQSHLRDLGTGEQHGRGVLAGGDAGSAADARCGVHRLFLVLLGDQQAVGVRSVSGVD